MLLPVKNLFKCLHYFFYKIIDLDIFMLSKWLLREPNIWCLMSVV